MIRERARLPEREYIFKHQLTQEAAYESLLRRERRALHRRVAEALEQLYPERIEEQLACWPTTGSRPGRPSRRSTTCAGPESRPRHSMPTPRRSAILTRPST